jgi:2-C-methyl-D-erythritol 4-phosphate cytidylyltransferase
MNTAIILAGGIGKRINSNIPKQFINIKNKMILEYSIHAFSINRSIDKIIVICNKNWLNKIQEKYQKIKIITGGSNRTESSYIGLLGCDDNCTNVLIHDAARPFISQSIINNSLNYLKDYDSAVPVVECDDSLINQETLEYTSRNNLKILQTPQAFNYKQILKSYNELQKTSNMNNRIFTDNLSVLLRYNDNINVKLFDGEKLNFKITTKKDLVKAKLLIE